MRLRIVVALIVLGVGIGAPAWAATFPDLPGMEMAEDAANGQLARVEVEAPSTSSGGGGTTSAGGGGGTSVGGRSESRATLEGEQPQGVKNLPGTGMLPILGEARPSAARHDAGGQGLYTLAALGTLTSAGAYLALRRRFAL